MPNIIMKLGNKNVTNNFRFKIQNRYFISTLKHLRTCLMRGLDATQQTSPEPVSRMSVETTHPPNEHDNIFAQLNKLDVKSPRVLLYNSYVAHNEHQDHPASQNSSGQYPSD